ncbi:hypothetical protein [Mycobacterium sp.]|uniref:hypothetical protein n=1 Tax=Mycobacterium sp. TaxID=1785 RepID=UPI002BC1A820|nr:hypothetical protein [Mycobacterium sp.]HTQ21587.1 hypothetical protein [Mycobacterium sp.]
MLRTKGAVAALGGLAAASVIGFTGAAHAAPSPGGANGPRMYGNPAAAAPFWRRQHGNDCAEMAVADVVGEVSGREPSEPEIKGVAQSTPSVAHPGPIWHPPAGTDSRDIPILLGHYGIRTMVGSFNTAGLEQFLDQGRKVIAGVNSATLWNLRGDRSRGDHFVVVTGIDTRAGVVHLNDSGIDSGRDEQLPIAAFERAWGISQNLALVTA